MREIPDFTYREYNEVYHRMLTDMQNLKIGNYNVVKNAFSSAVSMAPKANASDFVAPYSYNRFYIRMIKQYRRVNDTDQSWRRVSGDALEFFLVDYYNDLLSDTEYRLIPLTNNKKGHLQALKDMGICGKVGNSKLDIAIIQNYNGKGIALQNGEIIGGVHVKASLAERVSDDVPASQTMMERGYLSYLFTLDVKSFPPSGNVDDSRAYVNKGELGTHERPTDKRKYIEEHGSFNACFSMNARTEPSPAVTTSGRKIYTIQPNGKWDDFCRVLTNDAK